VFKFNRSSKKIRNFKISNVTFRPLNFEKMALHLSLSLSSPPLHKNTQKPQQRTQSRNNSSSRDKDKRQNQAALSDLKKS
jgi:hypothetical protein